ncbi:hypothetical protein AN958_08188 [Leucoagaricus sp. SymC.cos]|nr:hypothetical protein AN958_08188 [Leucoagaricus sp. SymC.cos]
MSPSVDNIHPFPIPLHMYPFIPPQSATPPPRPKRRQVKNACTHCQKACKKCDDARPCLRCVKYGFSEECINSQRKQRKKGIKRGPYKKRDGRGRAAREIEHPGYIHTHISPATLAAPPGPYSAIPAYCSQYTPAIKHGDPIPAYPYYVAQVASNAPIPVGQDGNNINSQPQPTFYPIFHAPFAAQPVYPHSQPYTTPNKF